MIRVKFCIGSDFTQSVEIEGHANFEVYGKDIVCAAVSSAISMFLIGIEEVLKIGVSSKVGEGYLEIGINSPNFESERFCKALRMQLENIRGEYPKNITIMEVKKC